MYTFANFDMESISHAKHRTGLFLMTHSVLSENMNNPSNQNASGHKALLHARSIKNSWGQVSCFGHNTCWTMHCSHWFMSDRRVMLCEESVAAEKGHTPWRGWKVKFPWDELVTEGGDSCDSDHRDVTALLHVLVGEGKDWKCKNIKYGAKYHSCAIPKPLQTRSDNPKYKFHRQGCWRARLLNAYTSEPLLTPALWIRTCLLKENSQLNWFANQCWKIYGGPCGTMRTVGRQVCPSLDGNKKSFMSCVLTSSNFLFFSS